MKDMIMKRLVTVLCLSVILSVIVVIPAYAQSVTAKTPVKHGPLLQINKYFSTQTTTYSDGKILNRAIINGPPVPPLGYELERTLVSLPEPNLEMGTNTLEDVPAFRWVFGCSAVSGAMVAGYYDRSGFPNMYTGPTGGGLIPLTEDDSWGDWTDTEPWTYPNNPLVASHKGLDGRTEKGSIDDYWIEYLSDDSDPYITGGWSQHIWWDAIGDFMKTSQSVYGNVDGSTSFWYIDSATPLTCAAMEGYDFVDKDGTYGRKLFYEARGYTVTDCYTQMTDNKHSGGFSFAQYKAEIDAGRPVFLNLVGHSIVGFGYDDSTSPETVYIHDTWNNDDHTMPWGGSYSGMELWSVSIVNLQEFTSSCGDGYCAGAANGEDCVSCPKDCIIGQGGSCSACWKGMCDGFCHPRKETSECADCAEGYCCGDGVCEGEEDISNCHIDCSCSINDDCDDNQPCTDDVCNDDGSCENNWPNCGLSDGCCGPECSPGTDPDCLDCSACFKEICDGVCHPKKDGPGCPDCQ